MIKMKISRKDRLIIRQLLDNSRMLYSDLGRACRISRQTALNRVKYLKKHGVIEKFTIRPGYEKMGLDFRAYVLVTAEPDKGTRSELDKFLQKDSRITQAHHLFGRFDFFLEAVVSGREELSGLLKEIHGFKAVKKTETFIVYETMKYEPEAPVKQLLGKE